MSASWTRNALVPGGPFLGLHEAKRAAAEIRRLRGEQKLTQKALGERLGVSLSWIAERERGSMRLRTVAAARIAEALGTDLAGLTGGAP